jgi:membrane protease YdiL (CAAX protease family)
VLAGFAVAMAGTLPWVVLAGLNSRLAPAVPWAAPVMAGYLWLFWRYLSGRGWPQSTADTRRERLRAGALAPRVWAWSLLATGLGFAGVIAVFLVVARLVRVGIRPPPEVSGFPVHSLIVALVMSAIVAGLVEEAAFRGYMQTPIERRHGRLVAALVVAVVFGLMHLTHGFLPVYLLANAAVSVVLSLVVSLTGSIRPGIVVHTASDIVVPVWMWTQRGHAAPPLVWQSGPDASFWIRCAAAAFIGGATVWAFQQLARAVGAPEESVTIAQT